LEKEVLLEEQKKVLTERLEEEQIKVQEA